MVDSQALSALTQTKAKFEKVSLKYATLQGKRMALAKIAESLADGVSKAKGRLSCSDEAVKVFQEMQRRANSRAVSDFEELLSAILSDVLPNEGRIKLDLDIKSGAACLGIGLLKAGSVTDVLEDNGGAVTNVVCAGLKFAALSRTNNRKFLVLDEPDCWVKPELVPSFLRVIADVALQIKTQTLIVSHHPAELLGENINRVKFTMGKSGKIKATVVEPIKNDWSDDREPGFRSIELINFKRHIHTTIPCFPGATAFIGDNNLGKSAALVSSFKAVAYNESSDSNINHDAKSATIIYHLEEDRHLIWSRDPSRNPVVLYELYQGDLLVKEGRPPSRGAAPDWVTDLLGIRRADGLELQLGHQKAPIFLLDQSAPKRAQLLSIGRESGNLVSLMQSYEELKRADKILVKTGEKDLGILFSKLSSSDVLDNLEDNVSGLREKVVELEDIAQDLMRVIDIEGRYAIALVSFTKAEQESRALAILPPLPQMKSLDSIDTLIELLDGGEKRAAKLPEWASVEVPSLGDILSLESFGKRIAFGEKFLAAIEKIPNELPHHPELKDIAALSLVMEQMEKAQQALISAENLRKDADTELIAGQTVFDELMASFGNKCPLCDSVIDHRHPFADSTPGVVA